LGKTNVSYLIGGWVGPVAGKELFEERLFLLPDSNPDLPGHILISTLTNLSQFSLFRIISKGEVRIPTMKYYEPVYVQLQLFFSSALDGNVRPVSYSGPFKLVEDPQFSNE
jgi:hypothetical protein